MGRKGGGEEGSGMVGLFARERGKDDGGRDVQKLIKARKHSYARSEVALPLCPPAVCGAFRVYICINPVHALSSIH